MIAFVLFACCTSLATFAGIAGARQFDRLTFSHWIAPLVAAFVGVVAVRLLPIAPTYGWITWTTLLFIGLAAIATIDAATQTIPDALCLGLAALGLCHSVAFGADTLIHASLAGILILIAVTRDRLRPDTGMIGSGDLFLLAAVIAWIGPVLLIDVLIIAAVVCTIQMIFTRNSQLPFAPATSVGLGIIWLGGPLL